MAFSLLKLTHSETAGDITPQIQAAAGNAPQELQRLERYLGSLAAGVRKATLLVGVNAVQASQTFTLSSCVATDTAVVNGVSFACVASGATGNQFNVGGTDTLSAVALAAAINASVTAKVSGYVTASSAGAVVTVTAIQPGLSGNMFTTTATGGITAGAATLAGGTAGTELTYNFGT